MPKRGSRGFRWSDLADEHKKAISFFTNSRGDFPSYTPCYSHVERFVKCLGVHEYRAEKCQTEIAGLNSCMETAEEFNWEAMRRARRMAKVGIRSKLTQFFAEHPLTRKRLFRIK